MKAQAIRIPDLAREVCPLENIGYEDAFSIDIPTPMMTKKYSAENGHMRFLPMLLQQSIRSLVSHGIPWDLNLNLNHTGNH